MSKPRHYLTRSAANPLCGVYPRIGSTTAMQNVTCPDCLVKLVEDGRVSTDLKEVAESKLDPVMDTK